jgi:hypothetical protein
VGAALYDQCAARNQNDGKLTNILVYLWWMNYMYGFFTCMLRQVTIVLHQVTIVVDMRMMANAMCHNFALSTPTQPIVIVSCIR